MRKKLILLALSLVLVISGCSSNNKKNEEVKETEVPKETTENKTENVGKKQVYVSNYPIYDLTKKIAGDKVDVINVTGNAGFHHWEPSAKDIANIQGADLFIYNGKGLEKWVDSLIENKTLGENVIGVSKDIELLESTHDHDHDHDHDHGEEAHDHDHDHDHEEAKEEAKDHDHDHDHKEAKEEVKDHDHDHDHKEAKEEAHDHDHDHDHEEAKEEAHDHDHDHGKYDPHIWLSLRNGRIMLKNITEELSKIDPDNKEFYEANLKEYDEKFKALDEKYADKFKNPKRDTIIVSHEAYGYLTRDYNFKQLGIEGINAEGEPSVKQIENIIQKVKEIDAKTIFYEESISPKVAEMISKEVGAKLELLSPMELLTKEQIDAGKEYLSVMEDNLEGIIKALNE